MHDWLMSHELFSGYFLQAEKFMKRAYFWAGFTLRQGVFLHIFMPWAMMDFLGLKRGLFV